MISSIDERFYWEVAMDYLIRVVFGGIAVPGDLKSLFRVTARGWTTRQELGLNFV
jgi:hypothetical protein